MTKDNWREWESLKEEEERQECHITKNPPPPAINPPPPQSNITEWPSLPAAPTVPQTPSWKELEIFLSSLTANILLYVYAWGLFFHPEHASLNRWRVSEA